MYLVFVRVPVLLFISRKFAKYLLQRSETCFYQAERSETDFLLYDIFNTDQSSVFLARVEYDALVEIRTAVCAKVMRFYVTRPIRPRAN